MTRRVITTDRLIAGLAVVVLLLGAAVLWVATHSAGLGREPTPQERVTAQLRQRDPRLVAAYTQAGKTEGVVCGFTGTADSRNEVLLNERFVSRRNRIMFETDPLRQEFDDQFARECSGFLTALPAKP